MMHLYEIFRILDFTAAL